MQVSQYIFQSPYTSPVQVGRLDASTSKDQGSSDTNTQAVVSNPAQQKAQEFVQTKTQEVQASVDTNSEPTRLLDVVV